MIKRVIKEMMGKKNKDLVISRDNWEISREYKKAPFKQRYLELEEAESQYDLNIFNS